MLDLPTVDASVPGRSSAPLFWPCSAAMFADAEVRQEIVTSDSVSRSATRRSVFFFFFSKLKFRVFCYS